MQEAARVLKEYDHCLREIDCLIQRQKKRKLQLTEIERKTGLITNFAFAPDEWHTEEFKTKVQIKSTKTTDEARDEDFTPVKYLNNQLEQLLFAGRQLPDLSTTPFVQRVSEWTQVDSSTTYTATAEYLCIVACCKMMYPLTHTKKPSEQDKFNAIRGSDSLILFTTYNGYLDECNIWLVDNNNAWVYIRKAPFIMPLPEPRELRKLHKSVLSKNKENSVTLPNGEVWSVEYYPLKDVDVFDGGVVYFSPSNDIL
jgi:hypothetical protein